METLALVACCSSVHSDGVWEVIKLPGHIDPKVGHQIENTRINAQYSMFLVPSKEGLPQWALIGQPHDAESHCCLQPTPSRASPNYIQCSPQHPHDEP